VAAATVRLAAPTWASLLAVGQRGAAPLPPGRGDQRPPAKGTRAQVSGGVPLSPWPEAKRWIPLALPMLQATEQVLRRNNVRTLGRKGARPLVFVHGFGCDQGMWRFVTPAFEKDHEIVLLDLTGMGGSDRKAYDKRRHGTLQGHADDVVEVVEALGLKGAVFVGHSVSAVIGVLAVARRRDIWGGLVMVGPSPRYINDEGYFGGFERNDIEGLLEALENNYLGWSAQMAPVIMGNPDRPELGQELTNTFCQNDPAIARHFARVTFLSDHRHDLPKAAGVPTLILQCSQDAIAPEGVGRYVHEKIPGSEFVHMKATGHCPNLSHPEETVEVIRAFLSRLGKREG